MTTLVPQLPAVTVAMGVGAAMILLGLRRGMLRARAEGRRCPSCGRLIDGRVCRACTGQAR